jgi:hypothetical protein
MASSEISADPMETWALCRIFKALRISPEEDFKRAVIPLGEMEALNKIAVPFLVQNKL